MHENAPAFRMLPDRFVIGKYPQAEPEALRLLAPQRGLTATGESKARTKAKTSQCHLRDYISVKLRENIFP
jgi:hypothetical protein